MQFSTDACDSLFVSIPLWVTVCHWLGRSVNQIKLETHVKDTNVSHSDSCCSRTLELFVVWSQIRALHSFSFLFFFLADKIPLFVSMSQKHDRNISDSIFIKDSPITFDVKIHDPSYYLNNSAISYKWNFGDGSGLFVESGATTSHSFALEGNFTLNLTVQAIIPVPCKPVTPTPSLPTPAGKSSSISSEDLY